MAARFRAAAPRVWRLLAPAALLALAPAGRARAQSWGAGLTAGAETGAITNPRYQTAGDSTDVVSRARIGLGVSRRSPRTAVRAAAAGDWQRFRSAAGLSQFTYGLSADVERRVTPRLTARGGLAARTSLARGVVAAGLAPAGAAPPDPGAPDDVSHDTSLPAADGLPILPLALTRTYAAAAGAAYRASERTTLAADGGASRVTFAAPGLAGGVSVQARLRAARQAAADDLVGLTVQSERTTLGAQRPGERPSGRPLATESVLADWTTGRLPGALRLRLAAGASAFAPAPGALVVRPVGGAELGGPAARGVWAVRYARAVSPTFGVGRVVATDQAGVSYARLVPGGLTARLGYNRAWLHTPTLPGARLSTAVSTADVQRPIAAGLWAGVGAARYTRTPGAVQGPAVRSRDLTLRAGYAGAWGGGAARGTAPSRPFRHP